MSLRDTINKFYVIGYNLEVRRYNSHFEERTLGFKKLYADVKIFSKKLINQLIQLLQYMQSIIQGKLYYYGRQALK